MSADPRAWTETLAWPVADHETVTHVQMAADDPQSAEVELARFVLARADGSTVAAVFARYFLESPRGLLSALRSMRARR